MQASYLIEKFQLQEHPEGGFFKETYRCAQSLQTDFGERNYSTGIYFLIPSGKHSWWHRIKSDEMWHFYLGGPLEIFEIDLNGQFTKTLLGQNLEQGESLQYVVKAGHWFGARCQKEVEYSFVGCTVSPGFDFQDFELDDKERLLKMYPHLSAEIKALGE